MNTVRVYLPATVSDLRDSFGLIPRKGFAATTHDEEQSTAEDVEAAEYVAFLAAGDAAIDSGEVTRIVIAADAQVKPTSSPGVVEVDHLPWSQVVSIHIDDLTDAQLLSDISLAQTGDEQARKRVNRADLMWYDITERDDVVKMIAAI